MVASLRWWAKWTTPTSRTATFTSERFSHQVRWMPDPPATFSVPFSRSRSTSSAHIVRLVCSSVSQELHCFGSNVGGLHLFYRVNGGPRLYVEAAAVAAILTSRSGAWGFAFKEPLWRPVWEERAAGRPSEGQGGC